MHKYSPFSIYQYLILIVLSHSTCAVADSGVSNETGNKQNRLASSLYYIEARDEACTIREMKLRNGEERVLYAPKNCPDKFIAFGSNHILLVFKNYIQEIQLQPQLVEGPEISFPVPKVKPKGGNAEFSDAGYSANGDLSIVMTSNKTPTATSIKNRLIKWYRQQAQTYLAQRTKHYAEIIGVKPRLVNTRTYSARWGCCSHRREITYNWLIIMAPEKIIDYIIVHELCHIKEHNHSKAFWAHVEAILPDYKLSKKWLNTYGQQIQM